MPKPCETAARKLPKRCFWNLLKTKKKSRLKQSKPLRNVRLGSLQATRPNSRKRCLGRACEKAEPQQVLCPSHCETAAGKMPKRRCWNPLERKKYMPKPCEHQQVLCPSHCETVAGKMPKRRCWNPLKRERNRARTAARFVLESRSSSPPPFDHNFLQQLPRRAPPHSDEGSADNDFVTGWKHRMVL